MSKPRSSEWYGGTDRNAYLHRAWMRRGLPAHAFDGRPHIAPSIRQWQGDSVGHWEGNTLVVDTTNFTGLTAYRGSGEKLHLIERFTRSAPDTLLYSFTVEDPQTWDKPWTAEMPWKQAKGPVYEWACHEGNSEISTILHGARVGEEDAAKK